MEASLSLSHGEEGGSLEPLYTRRSGPIVAAEDSRILRRVLVCVCVAGAVDSRSVPAWSTNAPAAACVRRVVPSALRSTPRARRIMRTTSYDATQLKKRGFKTCVDDVESESWAVLQLKGLWWWPMMRLLP